MEKEIKEMLDAAKTDVQKAIAEANEAAKKQYEGLKNELDAIKADKNEDAVKAEVIRIAGELKALQEEGAKPENKESLKEQLKSNKEVLKQVANRVTEKEVVVKTLLQRSGIENNQNAYDIPDIGQLATRKLSLYDLFPKLNLGTGNHNGTIRYYDWDEATISRAAAAVAEGAAFPESVAKFKKYALTIQKIGDTLPVTEEFFEDEALFAAELEMFLKNNVDLEIDRQLYAGDGTGNTITGLLSSIDAYTLPSSGSVLVPTIYDLCVKVSEQITNAGGSRFMPDVAIMNIATINKMRLSKDEDGNYVMPPFVSRDGNQVSTMTIVESNIVADNVMIVGDRRFARIYEIGGVVLSKGMVGTQFTEDEMTLKARKRLAFLIRNCDKGGFRKVTDIDAALTAIKIV